MSHKIIIPTIIITAVFFLTHRTDAGLIYNKPNINETLVTGLVGYWTFDGKDMAGNVALDASGNGNSGTLTKGPMRTIGKIGQALLFNGTTAYVDAGNGSSLNFGDGDFTVSVWYRNGASASANDNILSKGSGSFNTNGLGWELRSRANGNSVEFCVSGGSGICPRVTVLTAVGTWNHVVAVVSRVSTIASVYVNGSFAGSMSSAPTYTDSYSFLIGKGSDGFFPNIIDDVRIYNRTLSADEVKRLYQMGGTFKINVPLANNSLNANLAGWWTFDGPDTVATTSTGFIDRSGNGNTARLVSGKTAIGKIGGEVNFVGAPSTAQVAVGDASTFAFDSQTSFTISAWLKPNSLTTSKDLVGQGNPANTNGNGFALTSLYFNVNDGTAGQVGTRTNYTYDFKNRIGEWVHVVGMYDRVKSLGRVYVNGALTATAATVMGTIDGNGAMTIGNGTERGNGVFDGVIDDVRIYKKALSADEVKRLYKNGATLLVGVSANSNSLTKGLVGYWSFDGKDMSGITAYDTSGNGNNGTLTGGLASGVGKVGQGMVMDGVNDYVNIADSNSLDLTSTFTMAAWVYVTKENASRNAVITKDGPGTDPTGAYDFYIQTGGIVAYETNNVDSMTSARNVISLKKWQYVVITFDNNVSPRMNMYVDGVLVTTGNPTAPTDQSTSLMIGRRGVADSFFNGSIDEVRIYNRVLSVDEIKRLYNIGR